MLQDSLILGLDNTSGYRVVDSGVKFMVHPIRNSFMTMFPVILDMFYWGMLLEIWIIVVIDIKRSSVMTKE